MATEIVSSGALYYVEKDLLFYSQKHLPFSLRCFRGATDKQL